MLKKTDLKTIHKSVLDLKKDLDFLITEHDFYTFDTEDKARDWLNSLPIESLMDLCLLDTGKSTGKATLKNIIHKSKIRKSYYSTKEKLEIELIKLNIAKIDDVIELIGKI